MVSEPKSTLLLILSLTLEILKKVEFFNYIYTVKGIHCRSNHSTQLSELKKIKQQKTSHTIEMFSL